MKKTATQRAFQIGLVVQALFYVVAGINHFWHPSLYVSVMPDHYSHPRALVLISGAAEVLGGFGLLVKGMRRFAAWGLVLMLLVYFDVHIFMIIHASRFSQIPAALLYLRIPFQFALIAWAWIYRRSRS